MEDVRAAIENGCLAKKFQVASDVLDAFIDTYIDDVLESSDSGELLSSNEDELTMAPEIYD